MKVKICFLFLMLLPLLLPAQEMYFGIKGGLNVSNINNDKNNHSKLGGHGGGYFGLKFNEKLGASIELLYSQKGTDHYDQKLSFDPHRVVVFIDYIDIPLLFNYYFTPWFSGNIGLTLSTPIRGIRRYPNEPKADEDFLPLIFKNVVSMPIGITLEAGKVVNFSLRGDIGLSPIGNDMRKNNVLMLSIGFTLFRKGVNLNVGGGNKDKDK